MSLHALCMLPWILSVWWVAATWGCADGADESCARQGRNYVPRPDLPCDLVRNSFCDVSGESYPWKKLRKFVFENQAMIKRMYGYEKHSIVLNEELESSFYEEGDIVHKPSEKYSEKQQQQRHEPSDRKKRQRNSIRSNAFRARSIDNEPLKHVQYLRDLDSKTANKNREQDGRSLKDNSHLNSRSISSDFVFNENDDPFEDSKEQFKHKQRNRLGIVRISQGYSTRSKSGATYKKRQPNPVNVRDSPESTAKPNVPTSSISSSSTTSFSSANGNQSPDVSQTFNDRAPGPHRGFDSANSNVAEPQRAATSSETRPPASLGEVGSSSQSEGEQGGVEGQEEEFVWGIIQSDTETFSNNDGSNEKGTTTKSPPPSSSGPNPLSESAEGNVPQMSSTAVPSTSQLSDAGDEIISTATPVPDYTTIQDVEAEEGVSPLYDTDIDASSDIPTQSRVSSGIEISDDVNEEYLVGEFISMNTEYSPTHSTDTETMEPTTSYGTMSPSAETTHPSAQFPDELSQVFELKDGEDSLLFSSDRRRTNGKRPAVFGESRQPSHSQRVHDYKLAQQQKQMAPDTRPTIRWRRPVKNSAEFSRSKTTTFTPTTTTAPSTTNSLPPPPTPSSVPQPAITTSYSKGFSACPVEAGVTTPYWANNTRGEPRAILNLSPFDQYIHWERCRFEFSQMDCRSGCRCEQQYRLHRMLAFDPFNDCRGVFSDWFRFPSGCVCRCYTNVGGSRLNYARKLTPDDFEFEEELDGDEEFIAPEHRNQVNDEVLGREVDEDDGDLTDVIFETEEELLAYNNDDETDNFQLNFDDDESDHLSYGIQAQDRMDDFPIEEAEFEDPVDKYDRKSVGRSIPTEELDASRIENLVKKEYQVPDEAVLVGDPVHQLYSRANAKSINEKQKVIPAHITPQRRPRPHRLVKSALKSGQQPFPSGLPNGGQLPYPSGLPNDFDVIRSAQARLFSARRRNNGYDLTRLYSKPSPRSFRPLQKFYSTQHRWDPQASFPRSLSNPRFGKYLDIRTSNETDATSRVTKGGSNNLNFHHLVSPPPSVSAQGANIPRVAGNEFQTPQYFFNLTSHLIRTQQLGERNRSSGKKIKT